METGSDRGLRRGAQRGGLPAYAQHDRPRWIDDQVVRKAAESACSVMAREVRAVGAEPVQAVKERNEAVLAMVDAVAAVGADRIEGDRPTALWLADWRDLVAARARYADALAAGRDPGWAPPAVDGKPITERLGDVGVDCAVPAEIAEGR